jgi:hypothetical protein
MQNYLEEFPAFDDVLPTLEGFVDSSWHNDACPSISKDLGDESRLTVYVDWKNKEMSDFADLMGDDYKRFAVMLSINGDCGETIFQSNNWDDIVYMVSNFKLEAV